MSTANVRARGRTYWCPVCGAEVTVLAGMMGEFHPVCCNLPMVSVTREVIFYFCPVCGAEVAVIRKGSGDFRPVCCGQRMRQAAG